MICETPNMPHAAPMPSRREVTVVDLFCGGGGTSQGLKEAIEDEAGCVLNLAGWNHNEIAIKTFLANHPTSKAHRADLFNVNPLHHYKRGEVDILVASPECTNHSIARGGMPINDQSRCTAHCVTLWAEKLAPPVFIIENVRELRDWGPLGHDGKPLKSKKGETFRAWIAMLESLGYRVEHRLLRAADYGDPTTRMRLFIIGVRGRRPMPWPEQTHAKDPRMLGLKPWVPAREIIDWTLPGKSIFGRKKPLAPKTMRRIFIGLQKYSGLPFIVPHPRPNADNPRSVNEPLATVTATSSDMALAVPFLTVHRGQSTVSNIDSPAPTVTAGGGHIGVAVPYLVSTAHEGVGDGRTKPISEPLPTVAGNRGDWYLAEPFIVPQQQGGRPVHSVDEPVSTVATAGAHAIAQPFLVPIDQQSSQDGTRTPDEPLTTITTKQRHALVKPFLVQYNGKSETHPVDGPIPTVTTKERLGVAQPYIVKFYGTADAKPIDMPLDSITCEDRFGLAQPILEIDGKRYVLDIHFRMLNWRELAAAQGFPKDYRFEGNSTQIVKMIGNAVPKNMAKALGRAALGVL